MSGAAFTPDPSWPTIVELATEYWGEPTDWSRDEVRWGAKGSKSVKPSTDQWHDHEANTGGGYIDMWRLARKGAPLPPRTNGHDDDYKSGHTHSQNAAGGQAGQAGGRKSFEGPKPWLDIGVVYKYLDAAGRHVLDVIRTKSGKPRFRQRRPDPSKPFGWNWKTRDIPPAERPLYRLPELLASADLVEAPVVYVCEGEKDSDNLVARGLIATTNSGGASRWHPAYAQQLAGRSVIVLPDNDQPGREHAALVARTLYGVADEVRILELPGLAHKGDVSDWLAAGGVVGELERLAREAPVWTPPVEPPWPPWPPEPDMPEVPPPGGPGGGGGPRPGEPDLPVIQCVPGQVERMRLDAYRALLGSDETIYQRGELVEPVEREFTNPDGRITHTAMLAPLTTASLHLKMARTAQWQKFSRALRPPAWVPCDPPDKLVQTLLFNVSEWPFSVVRGVLTAPTLRPDGSLLITPGYDPPSRYVMMFPQGLDLEPINDIPDAPSIGHATDSLLRLDALLDGYPFVNDASRSVALSMMMTPVLRCAMPASPLHGVSARAPGTGKSHLVDLAAAVALGRLCPAIGVGKKDEELEKGLNSMLMSGVSLFSIDNVSRDLDTAILNIATERPAVTIRKFGELTVVEVENTACIFMTGNNLAVIDEQRRRTVRCDLDAGMENPERRPFDEDPIDLVLADRGRYLADVLTIARAYHVHRAAGGARADVFPLGSYGPWSRFVREPLAWLGRTDPAETQNQTASDDPTTARLATIMAGWWESFTFEPKTIADAVREARPEFRDTLKEHFPARGGAEIDNYKFGNWLRKFTGRVADGRRFVKDEGSTHGTIRWKIANTR